MPLLELDQVSITFGKGHKAVHAVREASLTAEGGEWLAIVGPSGSGKSTLLSSMGGMLAPDEGTVRLEGQSIYTLSPSQRRTLRNRRVGFVFQQFHLLPYLSVEQNVRWPDLQKGGVNGEGDRAATLIEKLGLDARRHHRPDQLSAGEKQRTGLARALINQPALILADEPTGNLDDANSAIVIEHLRLAANEGRTVVVVTHDHRITEQADRVLQMRDGRLSGGG